MTCCETSSSQSSHQFPTPTTRKTLKVITIGDQGVCKSSILWRMTRSLSYPLPDLVIPSNCAYGPSTCITERGVVKFDMWDTARQEVYRSLSSMYYRRASIALIVYDVTSPQTLDNLGNWITQMRENEPNCVGVLLGNKIDLVSERKVSLVQAEEFAKQHEISFLREVSALTGENIEGLLLEVFLRTKNM